MFSLFGSLKSQHNEEKRAREYREVLRRAAKLGGEIFGPVPTGVRREFFCLNSTTWIWHEEWTDADGKKHIVTTRYDVRPNGVLKAQDGQPYRYVELEEGRRLFKAVGMYTQLMHTKL
ncbi:MAG TPA: hypothetical protein VF733_04940 [Candidatus Saccharimonadales bacterium]